jgi:hypothetical protein
MAFLEADQLAFFNTLREGFCRSTSVTGVVEKHFSIAGFKICLRFAGPALLPLILPAIAHLEQEPADAADFTIELFDSQSSDTPLPFLAARFVDLLRLRWWEHLEGRREIRQLNGQRIRSVFHLGPDILSVLDRDENRAIYWIEEPASLPYYETAYPLSVLLNWWLADRGRFFVHAAAIGQAEGGVLLTGRGGSGKSTTTLACLMAEQLGVVGDDYIAIAPESAQAYSLYNTVKLKQLSDVDRFSGLRQWVHNLDRVTETEEAEKAMLFLHQHAPQRLLQQMPVRAILVPRVVDQPETRIVPVSAGVVFKALAPSTLFQLPGNAQQAFQALVGMVRRIPGYEIQLGRLPGVAAALRRFIEEA